MKKEKVLVIGGSGFLGSHLADILSDHKYEVTIFDKKKSQYLRKNQKMVIGDITDLKSINKAIKGKKFVYHFAGMADIKETNTRPVDAVKFNILGTTNILESCKKNRVNKIVFASSIYVYSDQGGIYRSTKQSCELLIENYATLYKLNFAILRFGSLYGSRATKTNTIYNFIHQALTKGKIERKGNGREIREYIHVKDAAQASVDILDKKYKNEYISLTGYNSIKIQDLLNMIKEMLKGKIKIIYSKKRIPEHYEITPYTFRPKIAKKYMPRTQYDLGQGILDVIYEMYSVLKK